MGFGYLVFLQQTNKSFQKILTFDNKNTEIKNEFSSVKNIFNSSGKIQKKIYKPLFYDLFLYGAQWLGFLDHLLRIFTIAPLCLGDSKVVIFGRVEGLLHLQEFFTTAWTVEVCFVNSDDVG